MDQMPTPEESHRILRAANLFAAVPDDVLGRLAEAVEPVAVRAGDVIVTKGERDHNAYVVGAGRVRVHQDDLTFNILSQGDAFGELAALDHEARSATVTAEEDAVLLRVGSNALYDAIVSRREAATGIIRGLCNSLRARAHEITSDLQQIKALERELEIGRQIQSGFLPSALPQPPGWEIAAELRPAREVAGDYFDCFALHEEPLIALVIGDVCDKGVGAALFMTLFRSLIRATANAEQFMDCKSEPGGFDESPASMLRRSVNLVNRYITTTHSAEAMFSSLFFATLNTHTGNLSYINAGHEPPVIIGDGGIRTHLAPTGPAVGILPKAEFQVADACIAPGESLFAYTDGVTEARDLQGGTWGEEALHRVLKTEVRASAEQLIRRINIEVGYHAEGQTQSDDITMLAVSRAQTQ